MTIRERTPEKATRPNHAVKVYEDLSKRPRVKRDELRMRRILVSTFFFGLALIAFSLACRSNTRRNVLCHRDLDRLISQNLTDQHISSSVEFAQQMARFNQDIVGDIFHTKLTAAKLCSTQTTMAKQFGHP